MKIVEEKHQDVLIFSLSGRLDSNTSVAFDQAFMNAIENGTSRFIVDCLNLEYISSAGLRVLNKATKKLKNKNGKIILCSMEDYIREVFEISGFDTFLPIVNNRQEALDRLNS